MMAAACRLIRPVEKFSFQFLSPGGLAEGVGFEPTIRFPVYTLSKRAPSATRPPLRTRESTQYSDSGSRDNLRAPRGLGRPSARPASLEDTEPEWNFCGAGPLSWHFGPRRCKEDVMGRGLLLWLLGIPLPIILLIWVFGGLHG
jgi:hypothetical protein